jgi:hypothetical protein
MRQQDYMESLKRFEKILGETNIQLNDVVMLIDPQPIPIKILSAHKGDNIHS